MIVVESPSSGSTTTGRGSHPIGAIARTLSSKNLMRWHFMKWSSGLWRKS